MFCCQLKKLAVSRYQCSTTPLQQPAAEGCRFSYPFSHYHSLTRHMGHSAPVFCGIIAISKSIAVPVVLTYKPRTISGTRLDFTARIRRPKLFIMERKQAKANQNIRSIFFPAKRFYKWPTTKLLCFTAISRRFGQSGWIGGGFLYSGNGAISNLRRSPPSQCLRSPPYPLPRHNRLRPPLPTSART